MKSLPADRPSSNGENTKPAASWRGVAVAGYVLIFLTFGVVGVWAVVAKIDRAVAAPGVVAIETNRKTVQHLEGGIIREILVKEGEAVAQGATLFRLENVQAKASYQTIENQLHSLLAIEARLMAERDQRAKIMWPEELSPSSGAAFDSKIVDDQVAEFNKRRSSLQDQVEVLKSRIGQLGDEIRGTQLQKEAAEKQVDFIDKELIGLRELNEKKLIPVTRLYQMEREREGLEGSIGQAIANIAKSNGEIEEYNVQIQQLQEKFQEDVAKSLVDVREKLSDAREKLAVTKDVLRRVEVIAPVAGTVQNLKVFTIGQVIRAGEPLLDIVPQNDHLIVEVQFSPNDIDGVVVGQEAEVRFPAFHTRMLPLILGHLESVSRDRLVDESSKQPYYRGIVGLDETEIPEEWRSRVRAGMPAEVIVASGERTVLDYIVSPLASTLRKGFID
jgi:membrane fusion protein, type I secretion system